MAKLTSDTLRPGLLPAAMALLTGSAIALIVFLLPAGMLEAAVLETGLPAVFAAAEPPLGTTARALIASVGGGAIALAAFIVLRALEGLPNIKLPKLGRHDVAAPAAETPRRRAAAAEPARQPIFAGSELGVPFNSVTAPPEPGAVAPPVVRLDTPARAFATERAPAEIQSLADLVGRLEAGMQRRRPNTPPPRPAPRPMAPDMPDMDAALRDALGTLQRMTARSH